MTPKEAQEKYDNLESSTRKKYISNMWLSTPNPVGIFADWLAIHPEVFDKLPAEESTGVVEGNTNNPCIVDGTVVDSTPQVIWHNTEQLKVNPVHIVKTPKPKEIAPSTSEIKSAFDPWGEDADRALEWYDHLPHETDKKRIFDGWEERNKTTKNKISWTDYLIVLHRSEPTKSAAMKEFEEKEVVNGGEHHYNRGKGTETIDYMEEMAEAWRKNGLPERVIVNLVQVLKYLSPRLGQKDDIEIEMGKALNYMYRAVHHKWLV